MITIKDNGVFNAFSSQMKTMDEIFTHHFSPVTASAFHKENVIVNWCLCFRRAMNCIKDILSRTKGRTRDDIKDLTNKQIIELADEEYWLGVQNLHNWFNMANSYYDIIDRWCDLMSDQDHIIDIIVNNYYPLLVEFLGQAKGKYENMSYR